MSTIEISNNLQEIYKEEGIPEPEFTEKEEEEQIRKQIEDTEEIKIQLKPQRKIERTPGAAPILQEEIEELKNNNSWLSGNNKRLEEELLKFRDDEILLKTRIRNLEEEIRLKTTGHLEEIKSQNELIQDYINRNKNLQKEIERISDLVNTVAEDNAQFRKYETEIEEFRNELQDAEETIEVNKIKKEDYIRHIDTLQSEIEKLKSENEKLNSLCAEIAYDRITLTGKNKKQEEEIIYYKTYAEDFRIEKDEKIEEIKKLKYKIDVEIKENYEIQEENDKLKEKIEALEAEIKELRKENSELVNENKLNYEISCLKSNIKIIQKDTADAKLGKSEIEKKLNTVYQFVKAARKIEEKGKPIACLLKEIENILNIDSEYSGLQ